MNVELEFPLLPADFYGCGEQHQQTATDKVKLAANYYSNNLPVLVYMLC